MNYEAERAMNQKRLRMEGEPGHGVVQGNGLPLNYMDNGHQIPYQPYAGAYNTHYPPPEAFAAYGPPPPGGYAPQNLSYAPPAHQNYPHHQSFPQQPQAQLHMQSHMVQGYGAEVSVHKPAWPPQPQLLPTLDAQKPLDVKQLKPEIKLEPADSQKRPHASETEIMGGDLDQPKIKIKTDIFKPDDLPRTDSDKPDISQKVEAIQTPIIQPKEDQPLPDSRTDDAGMEKTTDILKSEALADDNSASRSSEAAAAPDKSSSSDETKAVSQSYFGSPEFRQNASTTSKMSTSPGSEPKKRGRPKGSTNKPKPVNSPRMPMSSPIRPHMPIRGPTPGVGRPRGTGYQYTIRPFRKDFSGIQFKRRWSDDCLDSSHIPNEVYFGDVPVSVEILHNYYDANAERERLAAQAAHIAAQKAAAAKLAAAKLHARGILSTEVTTVDSSSEESSGSSGSDSEESDDDLPLKRGPGRPKGARATPRPKQSPGGRRGRPPVPPELRGPGITEMKKFCKAAGIRFDYKKLVDGCTKNKERVAKMMDLLVNAGLEGKPTIEKCRSLKQAKLDKKQEAKRKKEAKVKDADADESEGAGGGSLSTRRVTRGQTGVKPRQKIVISSDEDEDSKKTLSKLRALVKDDSDSN